MSLCEQYLVLITISLTLVGHGLMFALDKQPDFDDFGFGNSFAEFVGAHESFVVDLTNHTLLNDSQILGLEITDDSCDDWPRLGQRLTNIVCLRLQTSRTALSETFFSQLSNFTRLEYLHVQCGHVAAITEDIGFLTNLVQLRYLGIVAPAATNIDRAIYQNHHLKELFLSIGAVSLPNGIAELSKLECVTIHGKKSKPIRSLPPDFPKSSIDRLSLGGVTNLEKILPHLPKQLVCLAVNNCRLVSIPPAWFKATDLKVVNLCGNQLVHFPMELLTLPSVRIIDLGLNSITNVPRIIVAPGRSLKIELTGNPIQDFASENEPLVERGIILK